MNDADYLREMASETRVSVGHTKEGAEHAARLERIAMNISDGTKWIPIEERVPKNAEHVLVYAVPYADPMTAIRIEGGFLINGTSWFDLDDDACYVSHWMPLPEAPK